MQIVYLSNRPEILNTTIKQVKLFMPFITRATIICPASIKENFQAPDSIKLDYILDEDLTPRLDNTLKKDHQSLNYLLRSLAIRQESIEDTFIMSDDDARPILPISIDLFQSEGRHSNFYFYDLADWHYHLTDFDKGQQNTYVLMKYLGLNKMAYAAHMPQIISKNIYIEAHDVFKKYSEDHSICEWTSYFNYGLTNHPEKFREPTIYKTLCWPKLPGFWPLYVEPDIYYFENYYPDLYSNKGVFSGLEEAPNLDNYDQVNFEKIRRLRMIECGRFIAPAQKNDPWRNRTIMNRFLYPLVHYKNKLDQIIRLKDRTTSFKILNQHNRNNQKL